MEKLISEYIKNIDEYTIDKFAKSHNIYLSNDETKVIYVYLKNYWYQFYKEDPTDLFAELKEKLTQENYDKIYKLYLEYKKKIS